jgi:hypothetical protein
MSFNVILFDWAKVFVNLSCPKRKARSHVRNFISSESSIHNTRYRSYVELSLFVIYLLRYLVYVLTRARSVYLRSHKSKKARKSVSPLTPRTFLESGTDVELISKKLVCRLYMQHILFIYRISYAVPSLHVLFCGSIWAHCKNWTDC